MNIDNDINWLMNNVNGSNSSSIDLKSPKKSSTDFLTASSLFVPPRVYVPEISLLTQKAELNFSKNIIFNTPVNLEVGSIIAVKLGLILEHISGSPQIAKLDTLN